MSQPQSINLNLIIDQVAKDKGLERSVLIETLEQAILQAAKKSFGQERNLEARYDEPKGVVELFQAIVIVQEIVDPLEEVNQLPIDEARMKGLDVELGDELVFQIFYLDSDAKAAKAQDDQYGDILRLKTARQLFGRIAAQTVKQVIIQRTRDAEREIVFNEYADRKGELVTGAARRFEHGNLIIDLGRAEAILPSREQVPRESYRAGDRVEAYVIEVLRESKGPQIILSRTSAHLLTKLFEREVPEIAEGVVVIEAAAREPGGRAKIAVSTHDEDVDPVGACVGMKGSRVQAVVQELRGEKIDIVPWDEDPASFVCAALAPAEVSRVLIDEANHAMEIIVPDDQLSLAIGRRGQNVRLAAQLTGWKLDINSESRVKALRDFAAISLGALPHMTELLIETLYAHGLRQAREVADAPAELLVQIPGIEEAWVDELQAVARVQMEKDAETLGRMEAEREAARQAEARRHPDELSPAERLMRVRGTGEKIVDQLALGGCNSVEELIAERDVVKLAEKTGVSIKKLKQLKTAAESYLIEEAKLREALNAERAAVKAAEEAAEPVDEPLDPAEPAEPVVDEA